MYVSLHIKQQVGSQLKLGSGITLFQNNSASYLDSRICHRTSLVTFLFFCENWLRQRNIKTRCSSPP